MFTTAFIYQNTSPFSALAIRVRRNISVFAIVLFLLFVQSAASQPLLFPSNHKRYVIKTLNIEDGLQNNTVGDIITDTFGFTWVAAKTALQRYNGYRLETVQPVVDGRQFNIDYQLYFFQTRQHFIWMTCKDGILQYNPFIDSFTLIIRLPSSTTEPVLRPFNETKEGIWCAREKGLSLYSPEGRLIKEFSYPNATSCPMAGTFCGDGNSHSLFLLTKQNTVLLFNKESYHFSPLPVKADGLSKFSATETRLYLLHQNGIVVCAEKNGVYTEVNHFASTSRFLSSIHTFRDGVLASFDQHLLFIDSTCSRVSEITTLNSQPLLPVGGMKAFYEDRFGRLWVLATNEIKLILNYTIPFRYFAYPNTTNYTKSVFEDEEAHLVLVGQYSGGLQLYDTLGNPLWKEPLMTSRVKDIAGIEKLGPDEYFITTIEQGLYILRLSQKKFTQVSLSAEEERRLNTHSISWTNNVQQADDRTVLFMTRGDVIQAHFDHNGTMHSHILLQDPGKQLYCFHLNTNDNCLWVGNSMGTVYGKHANGRMDTILTPGKYQVRCLTSDAANNVWVGTDKGLFVYNRNNRLVNTFTVANGLLNDCIYSMLTDKDNKTVYAATNLGLSAIRVSGVLKNYTKERGLQENEFNSAATAKTAKGKLYFGGVNGVTAFYPSDITVENDHPSLIIYQTDVNDKPLRSDSAAWNQYDYHLRHNQSKLSFSLAAFGIYPASDYTYEYKMEGFDKTWTTTNNPVNISYHLAPGTYTFRARLVNFPSLLISRTIAIAPPFWETWWFYLFAFLLVVSLILLFVRALYQRKYKTQLQMLLIRQQVLAERERISRDLHDNIGAYASAISANVDEILYGAKTSDPGTLQRLKESAREIIIQLRDSIWALNKENQTVIMLSDRIKNYVQKLQPAYPDITFDVDETIEDNTTLPSITALHVLRIVQEAVHNAIRHSGCSSVQINISSCSPVTITVEDNGSGLPAQLQYGDGIRNMKARAADIGWEIAIANSNPVGCRVQLRNTN